MRRVVLTLVALALFAACGNSRDDDTIGDVNRAPKALSQVAPPSYDGPPEIGRVNIANESPFCSFFEEGHDFVFDDPDTWQFVFVTVFDGSDTPPDALDGRVMLNGDMRRVELITQEETDTGETRTYRTKTAPVAVLTVTMIAGEQALEAQTYTGTLQVTLPAGGAAVAFEGDCGV